MPDLVSHYRDAGFTDAEIAAHVAEKRAEYQAAGFSDAEINEHLGIPPDPKGVPPALIARIADVPKVEDRGMFLSTDENGRMVAAPSTGTLNPVQAPRGFAERIGSGVGDEPLGISPENIEKYNWASYLQPFAKAGDVLLKSVPAAIHGGVGALAALYETVTGDVSAADRLQRDLGIAGDMAMIAEGGRPVSRVRTGPTGAPEVERIGGGLPRGEDIQNTSRAIGNGDTTPAMEQKLSDLYEQKGIHPAEVAKDAQSDVTITQSILSSDKQDMPAAYGEGNYGYQFNTYEPEFPKKVDEFLERAREAGIPAARLEPFYDIFGKNRKTPNPFAKTGDVENPFENIPGIVRDDDFAITPMQEHKLSLLEKMVLEHEQPEVPYTDAQKQMLQKISVDEKAPEKRLTWDKLYTSVIDKLYPIGKAVKEVEPDIASEDNPYHLARLMTGHVGKADHFLNQATFDFKTYEANGASLKSILGQIKGDLNGFRAYAASARALELEGRGIKSGFDAGEPSAPPLVSAGLDAARTVVVEGRDKFEKPFRELIDYQNRVSQYLRDSGVLSEAGYAAMTEANRMYVPFTRVMGIDEAAQARGGSTLQARNPIRAIKGSARSIIDPIESVVRNTYHMIEMAEKNVVGTKLIDMLKRAEEALPDAPKAVDDAAVADSGRSGAMAEALGEVGIKKPDELASALAHASEPLREGEIAILRNGKRETYKVDPDLARAMKGLDAQSIGLLEKVLSYPASTLRAGAVTTPDFALRHTIRDFLYAATTFKGGIFTPMDMARGFSGLIMKDADYWDWLKGGGGNISMVGMDRQYLQADLRKLTGQTGLVGRAWNVLTDPNASMWQKTTEAGTLPFKAIDKFVLDPMRAMVQFAENASHLGAFKKTMRNAVEEPAGADLRSQIIRAAWASRDTAVDAARMGANMRGYNMITAFANIKLQDTDRVVRAIRDNPIPTLTKIGAAITAPSVILWAANHNDPRYAEIPQWEKDMFWLVMTPDHVFRVPKPWGMGLTFGSLPERLLDAYATQKPDAFKGYFNSIWSAGGPDFVPSAAAPIIDQFANRSTFTNRTLIPSSQEKFLPEYQYTPYTTELTKQLGQTIGAFPGMDKLKLDNSGFGGTARALTSPILMENYIRGWTGTLGVYALQAADKALRMAGKLPDPPQPASTLADIPVIRSFVIRYPTASAESIQSFYDSYESNKKYFDTWQGMAKDGNIAAMQHIQQMGGPMMFAQLDGVKQTLTQHNQLVRDIYKNPQIPPAEKRQIIDTLYGNMVMVARHGNDAIRAMQHEAAQAVSGAH